MTCNEIVLHPSRSVMQNNTVAQAARMMESSNDDLLAVCGPAACPIGVVTARDIVFRVLAKGRSPELTRVDEIMTTPPLFVFAEAPIDLACRIMGDQGVTRLLVLDAAGHLDGVISLADILLNASDDTVLAAARHVVIKSTIRGLPFLPRPAFLSELPDVDSGSQTANSARAEAELVVRGGTNPFKEFP